MVSLALITALQITGVVFHDRNANGVRDAGDAGIAGVVVSDQDTVVLTGADGRYRLPGRGYGIVFVSVPDGHRATAPFWRSTKDTASFALTPFQRPRTFTFVHASDTHISEQSAPRMRRLRALVDSIQPAFLLITGDLVRDALRVSESEARGYYDLFVREKNLFATSVFTVPGNHEIFGIERHRSLVSPTHPLYGKAMYRAFLGPDYYSFNYGGVHFIGLDTEDVDDLRYYGHVDSLQVAWLKRDLAAIPPDMPVVTFNHIPFYMTADQLSGYDDESVAPTLIKVRGRTVFRHHVSNADTVLAELAKRRHPLALGGHVHMRESITYEREGQSTRFENAAAVVAPTATGGRVFPSGITLYTVRDGVIDAGRFIVLK